MRRRALIALLALAGAASWLAAAGPAVAEHPPLPNWPELLPPNGNVPDREVRLTFDVCPAGEQQCPADVIEEMIARWRPLDRRCDHRAVFALTYLRTTQEYFRTVKRDPGFFSDLAWANHEDAVFAALYFRAFDRYVAGEHVPHAWRIAFDAARSPNVSAVGDLFLGMSAHINRDLPYTLAHVGLVKPDGSSRKRDHDRVNRFLERVADPLQLELANRYDPLFALSDARPSPLEELAVLQMVRGWRENAWRNAQMLVNARGPAARARVAGLIEAEAVAAARTILAGNTVPGYGPIRDAHCRAH